MTILSQKDSKTTLACIYSHPAGQQTAPWATPRASTSFCVFCFFPCCFNFPFFRRFSSSSSFLATSKCARVGRASPGGSSVLEERPTPGAPQSSRNRKTLIKEIKMIIREIFLFFQLVFGSSWVEPNVKINIPKEVKFVFFFLYNYNSEMLTLIFCPDFGK